MYTSKYYTCEQIDQRLLQGYYDDAVAAGYKGTKDEFVSGLNNAVSKAIDTAKAISFDPTHTLVDFKTVQAALEELLQDVGRVDITELDSMTSADHAKSKGPIFYKVTASLVSPNNKMNVGILLVNSDNLGHLLRQTLITQYLLTEEGAIDTTYHDHEFHEYTRYRLFHSEEGTESTWTAWEDIFGNINKEVKEVANKKADKAAVDSELAKKFDKESVVQELGEADDKVMSQKAVKDAINAHKIDDIVNKIGVISKNYIISPFELPIKVFDTFTINAKKVYIKFTGVSGTSIKQHHLKIYTGNTYVVKAYTYSNNYIAITSEEEITKIDLLYYNTSVSSEEEVNISIYRDLNVVDSINQLGALEQIGSIIFESEQTNSIIFNMLLNLKEKTKKGKSVLLCIESDVDTHFEVFQRKGSSNVKSEDGYFITNKYYKFEIADDSVDRFFTYTSGADASGSSYKAKLILLNDAFCSMYDEINDLQEVLFDKYVSVISINSDDSGSIDKSIPFSTNLKKGDLVSFIIKADNISEDARINIRQRKGNTNITDSVEIEFNKEYIFEIADDSVNRFYLSDATDLAPNVSTLSIVKKKSEYDSRYLSVLSKLDTHNLSIETNAKDIQQNKDNISNLKEIVNNLQLSPSTTNVPKSFLEKSYAFGNSINLDGVIGNECTLKIFGGLDTITQQGNNLLYMTDKSVSTDGLTMSIANNIINVTGTPTKVISYQLLKFTLNKGTYSFYATVEGDVSDTNWTGLNIRISHVGLTNLDGSALTSNAIISSYGAQTYKVTSDNTVITLYVYCGASTVINGTAQIKVMVNSGETILPWEEPSQQRNINFNVKSPLTIHFGEDNVVANISKDYGLAVIPVTPTSSTESEQSIATYSNGDGDCYIADSIEYENGKLQYIQRIGKKVYSTGDTINEPYLSESILGLSDGYNVYYVLEEPLVKDLSTNIQSLYDGEVISTDNENAYMYCVYNRVKDINKEDIVLSRVFSRYFPETNEIESSLIDNNLLFIGSWQGDISRIDITNIFSPTVIRLQNKNGYIVRELLSSDDYLFAICRDPASATTVTEGLEYGKGLLQVIDKNTLEVKKNIKLKNKGTGGKIYGDYLYVMEQMWDMAVYSLKVLKDDSVLGENVKPIFQLNLDKISGKDVQWRIGEYQRIDFWYNSLEKKHYAIISAFDGGIHFFDVTNLVTMPSNATNDSEQGTFGTDQDWTTFTNARDIIRIGGVRANFGTGSGNNQVFDVVVDYPYAYLTSAPKSCEYKYAKSVVRGVVTINISDVSKFKVLADKENEKSYQWNRLDTFPEGTIVNICNIPYEDWSPHINEGDLHPSRIKKIGDVIITNNGKKGVALYRIKNGIPSFDKNIYLGGFRVTALSMFNSNSIIAIHYQSSTNILTTLYNIGNVNY